jgi:N-acetylmuramoyl-L-alanine amidase
LQALHVVKAIGIKDQEARVKVKRKEIAWAAMEVAKRLAKACPRITPLLLVAPLLVSPLAAVSSLASEQPILAFSARVAGDAARTRVVIDFERKPEFSAHYVSGPERIIVDLSATAFGLPEGDLAPRGLFKDIRYGTMDADSARMVFTATRPVKLVMAEVQPNEDGGYRLVLDAEMTTRQEFDDLVKTQEWSSTTTPPAQEIAPVVQDGVFTVAVDAGHGGIDAGASGATTKTPEKTVTLDFARLLAGRLNQISGVKAFLTREDDTFLSLSERVTLARQRHADIFISLHADTLSQKDIRGATVYTLSDKASDRMAENLAARENLSDELAGFSIASGPPEVADILLDLTRRETQAFSIAMAENVVNSFEGQVGLINNPHRQANFQVLRAPDIPSVLLELGFLSNADDEKLLLNEAWRKKVADLIAASVDRYRTRAEVNGG